jgi:ubiquinone biosynthesis protein
MISMGLFLGSSILCTTNMQPRFLEVPVLGVLGYIGAFVLGVYVIVLTLKNRHNLKNNQHAD